MTPLLFPQDLDGVLWLAALTLQLWEPEGSGGVHTGLGNNQAGAGWTSLAQMTSLCRCWGQIVSGKVPALDPAMRAERLAALLGATQVDSSR